LNREDYKMLPDFTGNSRCNYDSGTYLMKKEPYRCQFVLQPCAAASLEIGLKFVVVGKLLIKQQNAARYAGE
jgi:hypothetical protein